MSKRSIQIVKDIHGKDVVLVRDILFKGRRNINWDEVEKYLKQYIGKIIEITDTKDMIYIGKDFPDEYSGSKYTEKLKGTLAKTKANIAQGLPELIKNATNKRFKENLDFKHRKDAKYGWYRYDSRIAMPITNDNGNIERYIVFKVEVLVRCDEDKKNYLYDIINIKKETSTPLEQ